MKLCTFNYAGHRHIGLPLGDSYLVSLDLAARAMGRGDISFHGDMSSFIESGDSALQLANQVLEFAASNHMSNFCIPVSDVAWQAPVPRPGKICGIAMNNSASNERKISAPDHPAFFLKPASCLIGHLQPIRIRPYYGSTHPEPELAIVIAKESRDIDASHALDSVFGYSIFNDITGNGMRAEDMFHYWALYAKQDKPGETQRIEQHLSYAGRYKGCDSFGCMGPWLVTRDEIANPDELEVTCKMAGEVIAEDSTRYYNFKVAEIISFISQFHTLMPGDIISCGTAFKPSKNRKSIHTANFLATEGPVEVSIEGLGTLLNPVEIENKEIGQWRLNSND